MSAVCLVCGPVIIAAANSATTKNGFDLDGASIPADEIMHGGPGRGGIPAINQPEFVNAADAGFLQPMDRVLGVSLNGVRRAYPIHILNYHEVVNDIVGDVPVVVTYCPLCGSGMAFRGNIGTRRLIFGVSGLLYNSDVLLYDLHTSSLWSQIKSAAISGPMNGTKLDPVPLSHTTWRDWKTRYPNSLVLSRETGFKRNYEKDPYDGYADTSKLMFPVAAKSRKYPQKSLVMGLEIDGHAMAYPFDELKRTSGQFTHEFQGTRFEIHFDDENQSARIVDENGNDQPTVISFWFAWYAFHPDTAIFIAE